MKTLRCRPASGLGITHSKGYVLATSLLLLVVMVMLGASMYGNVTVQEKMADNMRVKSKTLVAVKSAVQSNWNFNVLRDVMVSPENTNTNTILVTNEYDGDHVNLSGEVRICYLGESQCPGNSVDAAVNDDGTKYVCKAFFAAGHIVEDASNTSSTIEQAGFMLMPHSEDIPNCNAAQLSASGITADMTNGVAMLVPSIIMPTVTP